MAQKTYRFKELDLETIIMNPKTVGPLGSKYIGLPALRAFGAGLWYTLGLKPKIQYRALGLYRSCSGLLEWLTKAYYQSYGMLELLGM